jgi:hypothetical protein
VKLLLDLARNTIELRLHDAELVRQTRLPALLDIGEGGRLLGIEVTLPGDAAPRYLPIEAERGELTRSAAVTIAVAFDRGGEPVAIELPRRGKGYELSYPSGNQCWLPTAGAPGRFACELAPRASSDRS